LLKETEMNRILLIALLLLTACAQLPPQPGDAAAKRFEPVPDRAVIYVLRSPVEREFVAPIMLDDEMMGSTYRGTFMRLVVPAGQHQIAGFAGDSGRISLKTEAGKLYFINQTTFGYSSLTGSTFQLVDEQYGRSIALGGTLTSEVIK
jgi:hypothetical protein